MEDSKLPLRVWGWAIYLNMSNARRKELAGTGRGAVGKTAVVAAKDRGTKRVVDRTDRATLQGFVDEHVRPDAQLYTDDTSAYKGTGRPHESVKHTVAEYVRGQAHTNGVESFWSMLKRAHKQPDRFAGHSPRCNPAFQGGAVGICPF